MKDLDNETPSNYRLRRAIERVRRSGECGPQGDELCTELKGECKDQRFMQGNTGTGRCDGALVYSIPVESESYPRIEYYTVYYTVYSLIIVTFS